MLPYYCCAKKVTNLIILFEKRNLFLDHKSDKIILIVANNESINVIVHLYCNFFEKSKLKRANKYFFISLS